ncbi:MAG: DUF2520 domain-containing protein [Wenzhouxiangella sp.]
MSATTPFPFGNHVARLPVLHVYGCGRAARVIARWLLDAGQVDIGQVCNRTLASSSAAVEFIGAGQAVEQMDHSVTGGWLLLGLPDSEIAAGALGLSCRMPGQPDLVFHLSGSMRADVLEPLGCPAASVHPARAFADPDRALEAMAGTWCVGEGAAYVLEILKPVLVAAGARWLTLAGAGKPAYHAATVVASNYLVTMTDLARRLTDSAGMDSEAAAGLLSSLQAGALDNLRGRAAASVLTGPIERSDEAAMVRLLEGVDQVGPVAGNLFRALGLATLELAEQKRGRGPADPALRRLFTSRSD